LTFSAHVITLNPYTCAPSIAHRDEVSDDATRDLCIIGLHGCTVPVTCILHMEHLALRHQLAVYQRSVPRPRLRATDRLFWAWVSRLWSGWQSALAFVQPRTVIAWQRQRFRDHWRQLSQQGMPGRPRITKELCDLIRTIWQTNPTWGAPRIVGELPKLGIDVAKSTVETYGVRRRKPPSPTWKAFLQNHVKDLASMDFSHSIDFSGNAPG
jgi:putative transposase